MVVIIKLYGVNVFCISNDVNETMYKALTNVSQVPVLQWTRFWIEIASPLSYMH